MTYEHIKMSEQLPFCSHQFALIPLESILQTQISPPRLERELKLEKKVTKPN